MPKAGVPYLTCWLYEYQQSKLIWCITLQLRQETRFTKYWVSGKAIRVFLMFFQLKRECDQEQDHDLLCTESIYISKVDEMSKMLFLSKMFSIEKCDFVWTNKQQIYFHMKILNFHIHVFIFGKFSQFGIRSEQDIFQKFLA